MCIYNKYMHVFVFIHVYYMIIIIPLGGVGDRFKKYGYKNPKALIKIFGKPMLYYLLDSLNLKDVLDNLDYCTY